MENAEELSKTLSDAARNELAEGMRKLEHCISQLSDEQVWWRPRPEMNSIANLMLHLSGNIRQWIIAAVGGAKDVRNRPAEFSDNSHRPKAAILAQLKATVDETDQVLAKLTASELVAPRRIQKFDTNVTGAVVHVVSHFRAHVQEIIHMTRQQLGEKYNFYFVPKGPEQVSAHGPAI
jgi:hypothetical protein